MRSRCEQEIPTMNLINRLMRRLVKLFARRRFDARELGAHTLRDIGIDPMAAELHREARLWQKLAA